MSCLGLRFASPGVDLGIGVIFFMKSGFPCILLCIGENASFMVISLSFSVIECVLIDIGTVLWVVVVSCCGLPCVVTTILLLFLISWCICVLSFVLLFVHIDLNSICGRWVVGSIYIEVKSRGAMVSGWC